MGNVRLRVLGAVLLDGVMEGVGRPARLSGAGGPLAAAWREDWWQVRRRLGRILRLLLLLPPLLFLCLPPKFGLLLCDHLRVTPVRVHRIDRAELRDPVARRWRPTHEPVLGHLVAVDELPLNREALPLQLPGRSGNPQPAEIRHPDLLANLDPARRLVERRLRYLLEVLLHDRPPDLRACVAAAGSLEINPGGRHPITLHTRTAVVTRAALSKGSLGVVDRDHGHAGDLGCVAGKPHGLVAVDCSGLAGDVTTVVDLGALTGSLVDHRLEDLVDTISDVFVDHPATVRVRYGEGLAASRRDLGDDDRIAVDAAGCESRVRLGHGERAHLDSAEGE